MSTIISGVVQRRQTEDTASTPVELYANAVERLESAVSRLKGIEAPAFPKTAYRAIESIHNAARNIDYALLCIENSARLERED